MKLLCIIGLLLISACSHVSLTNWHEDLPPRSHLEHIYAQHAELHRVQSLDDYLIWAQRFYLGWHLHPRGWVEASRDFADTIEDEAIRQQALGKLKTLGVLIGPEWAKDSQFHVITTRHLSIWGAVLTEAAERQDQIQLVEHLMSDVKALLSRELAPEDIDYPRYYYDDADIFN